ncbi:MAG TPA: VTT domain-containing protein, partial [Thermoanaerobaculia bacterium]|nr:VTT domain-containing protein [Thermoanaerobaculia bacterium]
DDLHEALVGVLDASSKLIAERPVLGAALFVVLSALSAMLAFMSSAVLVPVALYAWGKTVCAILLWLGWILGGAAAYNLGRWLGRPVVRWLLPTETLDRYEDRLSKETPFGLIVLLQLAMPSEVPGYLLGLVRYPFWRYLLALALVELPYAVGTVYLGASFLDRRLALLLALGAAGAVFMFLAVRTLQRRLQT